ncbi:MAG: TIGR01440 family protein [Clostridia bacterium]|nr:TIGR01440 family protein [Clostridia bacterium]
MERNNIIAAVSQAAEELIAAAKPEQGDLLIVGCSSSEIVGAVIGHGSSAEAAEAVYEGLSAVAARHGLSLAAQCCEHLNRCVVVERAVAKQRGYEIVNVLPQPHAGGSWSVACWSHFTEPVVVEAVKAELGIDIGDTLIGMHLRAVAVPVRTSVRSVGEANLVCARTRPKFVGGSRAVYPDGDVR